ncbi:MAG: hypothetical protein VX306_04055 [Candidatus Thermoplasmatota archaeon]|nr:hypothetical protein [Candidatus Thermoplasmatota archaeon]
MECNLDARGRAARLIGGIAGVMFGLAVAVLLALDVVSGLAASLVAAGSLFGGAFAIFEARAGWCIVRAMGIRTPL